MVEDAGSRSFSGEGVAKYDFAWAGESLAYFTPQSMKSTNI